MITDFSQIVFDVEKHHYFLSGQELQELIGVNNYLKQFQLPFDRDVAAVRVAKREGQSVNDILAEWDAKGRAAIELGITVHQHIENTLKGNLPPADPFLSFNDEVPEIQAFNTVWGRFKNSIEVIQTEWIIGDAELGVAGTVDLFLSNLDTGQYHIWDWKTGKFDTFNQWQNLLPPFDDLDASKLNIYSLQVSLYRLIIERNLHLDDLDDLNMGDSYIIHLSSDGLSYIHKAIDFRPQLIEHFNNK